jgi:chromosome segregation ATPase
MKSIVLVVLCATLVCSLRTSRPPSPTDLPFPTEGPHPTDFPTGLPTDFPPQQPNECSLRCTLELEFDELNARFTNLFYQVDSQRRQFDYLGQEFSQLQMTTAGFYERLHSQDSSIRNFQFDIENLTEHNNQLKDEVSELRMANIELIGEISAQNSLINSLERNIESTSSIVEGLNEQLVDQSNAIVGYEQRFSDLEAQVNELVLRSGIESLPPTEE